MSTNPRTATLARAARTLHNDPDMGLRLTKSRGRLVVQWTIHPDPAAAAIQLQNLRAQLEGVEHELVAKLRRLGFSWDEVGRAFGLSRQGAQKKFADVERAVRSMLEDAASSTP